MGNLDLTRHPCFNKKAAKEFGRIHLPIAPACNVQCNFCDRKYDCLNESRPGVCSSLLSPEQALWYFKKMSEEKGNISVAGIAGPGDPFAEPELTMRTMRLLRAEDKDLLLCVSTNGLNLLPYIPELAELNVSHVTITINAVDPDIGASIYSWIRTEKRVFRGTEGASLLLENQLAALNSLKARGITVKINTIIIPGINDSHISKVAKEVSRRGADTQNCIPMIPAPGSFFEDLESPGRDLAMKIKSSASKHIKQMKHCQRCRADAAGLLTDKNPEDWNDLLLSAAEMPLRPQENRPYVAITSREGLLINQHLGEAEQIAIYDCDDSGNPTLVEYRMAPPAGTGDLRWHNLAESLSDCNSLLTSGLGMRPKKILNDSGIKTFVLEGLVRIALERSFQGESLQPMACGHFACGSASCGDGQGCG